MAADPLAAAIVTAAGQADAAIATLRTALNTIKTNEEALRKQLGANAKGYVMGRSNLVGIALGQIENTAPDARTVAAIASSAYAELLV